jgi:HEAT repeat protein
MTRRTLYVLSVIAVLLAARGAYAERLGGSYRGPEDMTKEKDSGSTDASTSSGSSGGGDTQKGDSGGSGGGTGAEGSGGGGSGGGSGGGEGGGSGGGSGSPESGGGGPDAGGGGDTTGGKSTGGTGSSGSSAPAGGGSSGGTGGRGKASSTTDQFYVASWFFEQNREQLIARYNATQNRRVRVPKNSSAAVFGVLPADSRQRSDVTTEDRNKVFDILKTNVKFAREAVVRDAAAIALGKLGTPAAVELLKAQLAIETDLAVKQDILVALGMSRSKDAVPLLADTLKNDKGGKLSSFALLGLGLSQDADHAAATAAVLDYFNANIRKSGLEDQLSCAAVALGALRATEAVKPLAHALGSAKVPDVVRCYCAQALGKFGSLEGKDNDEAVNAAQDALEKALEKSSQEVERAAAAALGNFGDASVAKVLGGKQGIGKPDPLSAGLAAVSLGRVLGSIDEEDWKGAPDELRTVAQSPEKGAVKSQYAHLALSYFGGYDKDIRKYYTTGFTESKLDKDVLSAMAMSAGLGGFSTAQTHLRDIAKDPGRNVNTRAYAAMAMGMVGQAQTKDTAKALRDLLDSAGDDPAVRRGIVLGLGFVGDTNDVAKLVNIIEATKEDLALARYVRGAAVIALGMIRDGNSIGKIQELTGRSDPRTRAYALAALGCLADKDEVPAMSQLFDSANFRQKCGSIDALMHQL